VKYETVTLRMKAEGVTQTLCFGPSGLLERLEIRMPKPRAQSVAVTLRSLKLDAPMKAEQFAFNPPEGYQQAKGIDESLLAVGKEAPDFNLPLSAGGRIALSEALKGKKAVLVNFWFYG